MWSPRDTPPPIEKIRTPQWTVENTRETQQVVDGLLSAHMALKAVGMGTSPVATAIVSAIHRFVALDPNVEIAL